MSERAKERGISPQQLAKIQTLAETLRYGSITLTFQDGVLVQIDRNEKLRLSGQTTKSQKGN